MRLTILLFLLLYADTIHAQRYDDPVVMGGVAAIATRGGISDLYPMLINEEIFLPTPHEERMMDAVGGLLWIRMGYGGTSLFLEGHFSVTGHIALPESLEGGHFYLENNKGDNYRITFDYNRTSLGLQPGFFLIGQREEPSFGLYITAGINWAISSGSRILYKSNKPQFDLGERQALRNGLKIRNDFGFTAGIGMQFNIDFLRVELRYNREWGMIDLIETQNNSFYWQDTPFNRTQFHQFTLGVLYPFYAEN